MKRMGIKGLFQFLKRFEKEVSIPRIVEKKRVAVDIFWFIHLSKGDLFTFQNYILPIIKNASHTYCVFDGHPSEEKKEFLRKQAEKRREIQESIDNIERFLAYPFNRLSFSDRATLHIYLEQLKRQVWIPPPEYIECTKKWLENKGCIIHKASEEADDDLVELQQNNEVEYIISNDSDILVLGGTSVIRVHSPSRGGLFDICHIQKQLGFTQSMWTDFMYLCKNMRKESDVLLAYSFISVYKDLEYSLQKYYNLYNDYLVSDTDISREE